MTQFPGLFPSSVTEGNQNNLQQQIPSSSYIQQVQGKQLGTNVFPQPRNGQNDFGISTNGLFSNQQHFQQQPMMETTSNPYQYYNPFCIPGSTKQYPQQYTPMSTYGQGCGYLQGNIPDQLRSYPTNSSPIFILPNGTSNCNSVPNYPMSIIPPTCIAYPMPLPIIQTSESKPKEIECSCPNKARNVFNELSEKRGKDIGLNFGVDRNCESCMTYCCNKQNVENAVCTKQNCPSSIQLQAMISQLLGIQGTISSTVTRLLLKRIPSSNVTDSIDDIMKWAIGSIRQMTKDQLLKESKASQEVNGLLRLYLVSPATLPRIIPILTSVQLNNNVLKALVENLINAKIMEDQGYGAENPEPLDALLLELKSDDELRELISNLREKECQERVNLSFAACNSQRLISESKLSNVQKKIIQVEKEMDRRHSNGTVHESCKKLVDFNVFEQNYSAFGHNKTNDSKSSSLFSEIHVMSSKKLLLQPHVGSPETTYKKLDCIQKSNSSNKSKFDSSFCEKNSNEVKCYDKCWYDKNFEEKKSLSSEICTSKPLQNSNEFNNNDQSLMDCGPNLEKIKNTECSILQCENICKKDNYDNKNILFDNELNITTNKNQTNKKKSKLKN